MAEPSLAERLETAAPASWDAAIMREAAAELRRLEGELDDERMAARGGEMVSQAIAQDHQRLLAENARLREALTAALGEVGFAEGLYELGLLCNRPKVTAEEEDEIIRRVSAITAKGRAALAPAKGGEETK